MKKKSAVYTGTLRLSNGVLRMAGQRKAVLHRSMERSRRYVTHNTNLRFLWL